MRPDLTGLPLAVLSGTDAVMDRYEVPFRGERGRAAGVVVPADEGELRELVRAAVAGRIPMLPQGANTGMVGASTPTPTGELVVVSTDRIGGVELLPGEAAAVVGAGTRLSELNAAAAAYGLHLPIDLGSDPSIGGMVATNTGGSRVMRHGPMRHHVLAVRGVTADADASTIGGGNRLRKDSRGVDVAQMLIGSGGALAIVTQVVVALSPVPARRETWWLAVRDPLTVPLLFERLDSGRPGAMSAFEFVSAPAFHRTLSMPGSPPSPFGTKFRGDVVLAEWSSADAHGLDALEADLAAMFDYGLITDAVLAPGESAWAIRHRVADGLRRLGVVFGHDVSTPRASLMAARAEAIDVLAIVEPSGIVCDFGHVGDGGLHLNLLVPADLDDLAGSRARVRRAVDGVIAHYGGSYSAEHGLGPVNAERWLATTPAAEQRLIAAFKSVTDPFRLLGHPGHPYNRIAPAHGA